METKNFMMPTTQFLYCHWMITTHIVPKLLKMRLNTTLNLINYIFPHFCILWKEAEACSSSYQSLSAPTEQQQKQKARN